MFAAELETGALLPPPPHPRTQRLETLARHRRFVVSRTSMITKPDELGSVLGVWGHPDDEAYLSAGLMMGALAAGNRAVCITATHGEAGFPDDDPRSLAERAAVRELELDACLDVLGVTEHEWMPYPDGACDRIPDAEPVERLCELIEEVRPDSVLTFSPDGQTGHVDHIAASRWTTLACRRAAPRPSVVLCRHDPGVGRGLHGRRGHRSGDDGRGHGAAHGAGLRTCRSGTCSTTRCSIGRCGPWRAQESQVEPLVVQMGEQRFREINRDETFRLATSDDWVGLRLSG